ncbi:MAG: segregation/condensation protein A [Clostridia bacterium]|nr:segregation/condensation protein A [Clostridia bacterium]
MESALTKACTIKIQNFEGPFDLLFHLIEKNQLNIYDIPINEITDQYMDFLFAMQQMDLEIASEFLVMAATLLHIKSRMLLPDRKEKQEDEVDPREELILKLVEYKRFKEFSEILKEREKHWEKVVYKLPEAIEYDKEEVLLELSPDELRSVYLGILERNEKKMNRNVTGITQIIQHEKVSLKSKMREVLRNLFNNVFIRFSDLFSLEKKSRTEVVTGFLAILELSRMKKVILEQSRQFSEIIVYRNKDSFLDFEDEKAAETGGK